MANSFSVNVVGGPAKEYLDKCVREADKATVKTLRAVGQAISRIAKSKAPLMKEAGKSLKASEIKARKRSGNAKGGDFATPIPGLLKASIHNSKVTPFLETQRMFVGPLGKRVTLYREKIERKTPFMRPALDAVSPTIEEIHRKAWFKAMGIE